MKTTFWLTLTTLLLAASNLSAATLYVSLDSTNATPPYTNWATAATNIQQAVGVAATGDEVVVTNGVYPGGVPVTNALALRSVNGPQFTVIDGGGWLPCVSLSDGASLTGFALGNGYPGVAATQNAVLTNCTLGGCSAAWGTWGGGGACGGTLYNCTLINNYDNYGSGGGGAWGATLYNCTLSGNRAVCGGGAANCTLYNCTLTGNEATGDLENGQSLPVAGGGAVNCTLYNCTLSGNWAMGVLENGQISPASGGGASQSTLYNCTVSDNHSTGYSGGVSICTLHNCIIYHNDLLGIPSNYDQSAMDYCCTTPQPFGGTGNIANDPLLVDHVNGDLHLLSNSPCINAGNNAYVATTTDLDGNPRIVSGTVDIGAYEYQGTGSVISYAWLQQYGLLTDGSADYIDSDQDGMNNWQEWICGTDPTNPQSVLSLLSATPTSTNATVTWQSVAGINYFLERSPNLASHFTLLATNILGQAGITSYADTNATGAGPFFYRVGVTAP
ncbi:MAG: choice-of-anchor Q domain-containing protein [Limisphaerales bacterium]